MRAPASGAPTTDLYAGRHRHVRVGRDRVARSRRCCRSITAPRTATCPSPHHPGVGDRSPDRAVWPIMLAAVRASRSGIRSGSPRTSASWTSSAMAGCRMRSASAIARRNTSTSAWTCDSGARLADEKLALLRRLLTGEPVDHRRQTDPVTPACTSPGGPAVIAGRRQCGRRERAATHGLGFVSADEPRRT